MTRTLTPCLLGLVALCYTSSASAEVSVTNGTMPPHDDEVSYIAAPIALEATVAPGGHLTFASGADGSHTCDLWEYSSIVDRDASPSHICYLRYTAPQDGRTHHLLILLHNTESHRVSFAATFRSS